MGTYITFLPGFELCRQKEEIILKCRVQKYASTKNSAKGFIYPRNVANKIPN